MQDMTREIVGNGDIAEALQNVDKDVLFFASGVSNSAETRESEYKREFDLLLSQDRAQRLVYFSSIGVFDGNSRYYKHKRQMEEIVKANFPKYCIVRLGNIDWGDNPNTIINALKDKIKNQDLVQIQDVYRYIVNPEEFVYWIKLIPDFNCEMTIVGRKMLVREIVEEIIKGKL